MITIGTSGYSYDDWKGVVYPEGLEKKNFLRHYRKHFDITEINSTYYRLPTPGMFESILKKVPDDFQFVVKFSKELTHQREKAAASIDRFREGIEPLVARDQLTTTLAQFPYSFKPNEENFQHLKTLRNEMPEIPINVEFRNEYWINEKTFDFLEANELGYVCVDMPRLPRLVPPVVRATTDLGYIRFHGRKKEHWWNPPDPHMRYDYYYDEEELEEWIEKTKELEKMTENIVILFNNHYGGKSAKNAKTFSSLLNDQGNSPDLPDDVDFIQEGKDLFSS
ncbi:DUF72 domain-containing protein [Candidatus Bipolaricaulota bacterium]|nr:DUF72 domain-containing protein [Candidatus Bipolaricaulota bacterium]